MPRKRANPLQPSSSSNVVQQTLPRSEPHHERNVEQESVSLTGDTTAPPSPTFTATSSTAFDLNSLYSALETASTSTRNSSGTFTPTGTTGPLATPPARVSSTSSQNPGAIPTHQPAHATEQARRYTVYTPNQWGPVDQWHRAGPLTQGVPGATCVRIDQPANNRGGGNDESDGEDEPPVVFQFHFPPRGATSAHYYVVIVGRIPGIYITWDDTQDGQGARSQVSGVRNSCHQSFPTWDGAMDAWTQALDAGRVRATVNPEAYPTTSADVPPVPTAGTGRYIAIFRGRHVGIFDGWVHCASHVVGVPNSIYNRFESFDGALAAFLDATQEGNVAIL
ncbi:hypothetical protein NLI96_g12580 [Meripilus lineatus]|uniref:Ribonuclease H1 N-terminal domain-containing protein n=1 Tax=Meripilus lineatus TaxID=2056292 RepID=A0AAD5UUB6_9APHY|nr:hypothetical protein NLI96_g12580 [Physisporinus lineatus]